MFFKRDRQYTGLLFYTKACFFTQKNLILQGEKGD